MSRPLIVERRTPLPVSQEELFAWHARPGAFERLVPPWQRVEVLERSGPLATGARVKLLIEYGPLNITWTLDHPLVVPGRGFTDVQVQGPFESWEHQHRFEPGAGGTSVLHDRISCTLPRGMGLGRSFFENELIRLLAYRHAVTTGDLAMHAKAASRGPLHIAITGASGLIGSLLIPALTTGGHRVTRIVRRTAGPGEIQWDPEHQALNPDSLRGVDAVIHLAGENVAAGRWTKKRKQRIQASRELGTRLLASAIAAAPDGPRTLVSASAIGYYGERGDQRLTETAGTGRGFLPDTAVLWEDATHPAEAAGVRVVRIRIGLLLTPMGGLLQRMLLPFRLGIGGRLAGGKQWMSWISADDLIGAFHHALTSEGIRGPMNAVAPGPVSNAEFTTRLAKALHRPALFPVPALALRALFGEMADGAILASARVEPGVLGATGYRFRHPELGGALAHLLGAAGPG